MIHGKRVLGHSSFLCKVVRREDKCAARSGVVGGLSEHSDLSRRLLNLQGNWAFGSTQAAVGSNGETSQPQALGPYKLTERVVVDENHTLREPSPTQSPILHRLMQGFIQFKEEKFLYGFAYDYIAFVLMTLNDGVISKETELFRKLAASQEPKVMVIACCDSRVCPTLTMGLEPGEVFTLRNVANLVPPKEDEGVYHGTSAALEFAVTTLQVEHIIVLGHSNCGGVRALMQMSDFSSNFIGRWMKIALPAKARTLAACTDHSFQDQCHFCEQESINVSLGNLLTFPWLEERFKDGRLSLHGWYYNFMNGSMTSWKVVQPAAISSPHLTAA